jgi:catechol 2,3-dioxygenase-like lactoylglutathione lyase family enzyme
VETAVSHQAVESGRKPVLAGVDHVQLPVPNIDHAVEWYTRYLGFQLLFKCDDLATLGLSQGPPLMLHQSPHATRVSWTLANEMPMPAFLFHTQTIHRLKETLNQSGATLRLFKDEGFAWVLKFADPYGNELGVLQYQPGHVPLADTSPTCHVHQDDDPR